MRRRASTLAPPNRSYHRPLSAYSIAIPVALAILVGALISADANQGWSTDEALQYVRAVADAGLDFFEQPVHAASVHQGQSCAL